MVKKSLILITCLVATLSAKGIRVGVVLSLTGAATAYGQSALEGVRLANSLRTTLQNGDKVNLVVVNTKGDKLESSSVANRPVSQDKVFGLVSEITTANTLQVVRVTEGDKISLIAPAATGDRLLGKKSYSSRVCSINSFQGVSLTKYTSGNLNYKNAVLVLDRGTDYSLSLARTFEKEFSVKGGKILESLRVNSGDKNSKAIIAQVKGLEPEFIFLSLYYSEVSLFVRQARNAGLSTPMTSADGVADQSFIELAGGASKDYIFTDSSDSHSPTTKFSKDFIASCEKTKGTKEVPNFTAMGADAYFMMFNALNAYVDNLTPVCVNEKIHQTTSFEGVSGVISIGETGNTTRSAVLKKIENQKQVFKDIINP